MDPTCKLGVFEILIFTWRLQISMCWPLASFSKHNKRQTKHLIIRSCLHGCHFFFFNFVNDYRYSCVYQPLTTLSIKSRSFTSEDQKQLDESPMHISGLFCCRQPRMHMVENWLCTDFQRLLFFQSGEGYGFLRMQPWVSCMLGKCSTMKLSLPVLAASRKMNVQVVILAS